VEQRAKGLTCATMNSLSATIERAIAALERLQVRGEHQGKFHSACVVGPQLSASAVLVVHLLGYDEPGDRDRFYRYVSPLQLQDGSFANSLFDREGSLVATAAVWGALAKTGLSHADTLMQRARKWLDDHGGLAALAKQPFGVDVWSVGPLLAYAGLIDPNTLSRLPLLPVLMPGFIHTASRTFAIDLLVSIVLRVALTSGVQRKPALGAFASAQRWLWQQEAQRLLRMVEPYQNPAGDWFGVLGVTVTAMAALNALGLPPTHPALQAGGTWLRSARQISEGPHGESLSYVANGSDVWNTGLAIEGLLQARAQGFEVSVTAVPEGVHWLVDTAHQCVQPVVSSPGRGRLRRGGWAFESANVTGPDTDTTALVLGALSSYLDASAPDREVPGTRAALEAGRAWLLAMQHNDGGFGAFMAEQPRAPQLLLFQWPMLSTQGVDFVSPASVFKWVRIQLAQLADGSTAALTARVVTGLVKSGSEPGDASIALLGYRYDDPGASAGDPYAAMTRAAADWLQSVQRSDGGWADTVASYADPSLAGKAERSMPGVTGLALRALLAVGVRGWCVDSAAAYLLSGQNQGTGPERGTWPSGGWLQVFYPPNVLYEMPFASLIEPLCALLAYHAHLQSETSVGREFTHTKRTRGYSSRSP
jgi:squalene-hopene/tetraprenyl-beta-curcumene cyclase